MAALGALAWWRAAAFVAGRIAAAATRAWSRKEAEKIRRRKAAEGAEEPQAPPIEEDKS